MKNPTIDDVARQAGFSKATVSAVINDSDTVKDTTREKILSVMDALNYRPRAAARHGFRTGKGKSLGLVIKEIDNPYYAGVIRGARQYANEKGYTILTGSSEGSYEAEQRIVEVMKAKDVDGLVIVPLLDEEADLSYLFELLRRNFPFVLLEEIRGVRASIIDIDNIEASKKAVQYLIQHGHTNIVHFAGPSYSTHSQERVEGVRRAFSESRLVFREEIVVSAGAQLEDGYHTGLRFFQEQPREQWPTAITCYNDLVAMGLMRALTELQIRVPETVSVIGYDDVEMLDFLPLPLTSVRVPRVEMGRKAAELLIRHIESRQKVSPQKICLEAELVVRQSTRALMPGALPDGQGQEKSQPAASGQ